MLRRLPLLAGALLLVAACGSAGAAPTSTVQPTLPLSGLPAAVADVNGVVTGAGASTTSIPPSKQVAASVQGNRVIVIGDSVTASTSRRYSNDMCNALVPLGWQVEVDAETGRFVQFGNEVLDKRLSAGWDAAVILLGNNYLENQQYYRQQLEEMVTRLSPRPIVLLTVTEFKPSRQQVNAVIRQLAEKYSNIMVVDWATTTAQDPSLTGFDHLHLTTAGRKALAANVALALGHAPTGTGDCLTTSFTDDSLGPVTGTSVPYQGSTGSGGGGTVTTVGTGNSTPSDTIVGATSPVTTAHTTPTTPPTTAPPAT